MIPNQLVVLQENNYLLGGHVSLNPAAVLTIIIKTKHIHTFPVAINFCNNYSNFDVLLLY